MTKLIGWLLMAFVLDLLSSVDAQAATLNAANCTAASVQTAINSASDGDTVALPSCPAGVSWTTLMTVTKGITIRGAGIGATVLLDNVSKGDPSTCGNSQPMIRFNVASPKRWRFSGLTLRGSAADPAVCQPGHVSIEGTSKAWRVDNVRIENQQTVAIRIGGDTWGVVDHSQFQGSFKQGVLVGQPNWGGRSYGDGSWAEPLSLGTEKAVYVEDCVFTDPTPIGAGAMDVFDGGRIVFRHNTATFLGTHGTESSGRRRGVRSYEIYNNTFNAGSLTAVFTAIYLRGGTGVIYNNTFIGDYNSIINAQNFRSTGAYAPWGQCNGSSPWDQNAQSGYACLDQVGRSTGALISGDSPSPAAWPAQALDPLYQWGNTKNGIANPTIVSDGSHIKVNRDFFNNVARPGYVPYPYPHPLTLSGPKPSTPTNLKVN